MAASVRDRRIRDVHRAGWRCWAHLIETTPRAGDKGRHRHVSPARSTGVSISASVWWFHSTLMRASAMTNGVTRPSSAAATASAAAASISSQASSGRRLSAVIVAMARFTAVPTPTSSCPKASSSLLKEPPAYCAHCTKNAHNVVQTIEGEDTCARRVLVRWGRSPWH